MNLSSSHENEVNKISKKVKSFSSQGKKIRIYHGSTNSTRTQKFKKGEIVDVSNLNHVIEISKEKMYAIVEPNVPMDQLVNETLKHNLIPPVVMEFPGITVGGGIQGGAGESSSFKWGGFHNTALEYEIILGNGEVITASPTNNSDLFYGTACSYGSLGIITKVKLNLIPAKPYVKVTYQRVNSLELWTKNTESQTKKDNDYVDGIMFSKNLGTVIIGSLSKKEDLPISNFDKASDDWFYVHAQKITNKHNIYTELVPIQNYLFRYDRGGFWVGRYAFKRLGISFNKFTRFIFNPFFSTRTIYRFLQAINISQRFFAQDISLPKKNVLSFLNYIDKHIKVYPLWICPLKPTATEKLSPTHLKTDMVINIGIWGKVYKNYDEFIKLNRDLEKKFGELGGRKVLYAHSYYTSKEFWNIYDRKWYENLRYKYSADKVFSDIYNKTKVSERYVVSPWKGLWEVIKSPKKLPVSD